MSDTPADGAEQCDEHKWEAKGFGHGGVATQQMVVWQCMDCGVAEIKRHEEGVIYDGW